MSTTTTITEALAELRVLAKRLEAKRGFVGQYLMRPELLKDPLEKDGGSITALAREIQAIGDLEEQVIRIRRAIQIANQATTVGVNGKTRPIADWLVWRRDVSPAARQFLQGLSGVIARTRQEAMKKGGHVTDPSAAGPGDVVVNLNEQALASQIEELEATLETLDGQLSLKNATTTVSY